MWNFPPKFFPPTYFPPGNVVILGATRRFLRGIRQILRGKTAIFRGYAAILGVYGKFLWGTRQFLVGTRLFLGVTCKRKIGWWKVFHHYGKFLKISGKFTTKMFSTDLFLILLRDYFRYTAIFRGYTAILGVYSRFFYGVRGNF